MSFRLARAVLDGRITRIVADPLAATGSAPADLARAVRAQRSAAPRVAAERVAQGRADAVLGLTGWAATEAAVRFALPLLPGATTATRATLLYPPEAEPVLAVDTVGAASVPSAVDLVRTALGAAAAASALQFPAALGLLALADTTEPAVLEAVAQLTPEVFPDLLVEPARVINPGEVLAGGLGAVVAAGGRMRWWLAGLEAGLRAGGLGPAEGASLLLGVPALVAVPAAGLPAGADSVASAAALAAAAVRTDLAGVQARAFEALVAYRRTTAGLT